MKILSDQYRLQNAMRQTDVFLDHTPKAWALTALTDSTMPTHSHLTIHGHQIDTPIAGILLLAAFQVNRRYLVFVADGIPHEETLRVYLIDENYQVIDKLWLSAIYSTGELTDVEIESQHTLTFSFFHEDRWRLTVHQEKKRIIPILGQPTGLHRDFSFSSYLSVKRIAV